MKNFMTRIQNKIDTSSNWKENNPILLEGEFGIVSDTKEIKVGDGINNFVDLETFNKKSDWNQNDESQLDYIYNRTHYIIDDNNYQTIKICNEMVLPVDPNNGFFDLSMLFLSQQDNLKDGSIFLIKYENVNYTIELKNQSIILDEEGDQQSFLYGGDMYTLLQLFEVLQLNPSIEKEDIPFVIIVDGKEVILIDFSGKQSISIGIDLQVKQRTVKQLDDDFIPIDYFPRIIGEENIFPLQSFTFVKSDTFNQNNVQLSSDLIFNHVYDGALLYIYINGQKHEYIVNSQDNNLLKYMVGAPDNGYFGIMYQSIFDGESPLNVLYFNRELSGTYNIAITVPIYNKIPNGYFYKKPFVISDNLMNADKELDEYLQIGSPVFVRKEEDGSLGQLLYANQDYIDHMTDRAWIIGNDDLKYICENYSLCETEKEESVQNDNGEWEYYYLIDRKASLIPAEAETKMAVPGRVYHDVKVGSALRIKSLDDKGYPLEWEAYKPSYIPEYNEQDENCLLMIKDGQPTWVRLTNFIWDE